MDKLEEAVEDRLVREVEKRGGKAYKLESPGTKGIPDRLVILPGGRIYFVECKRPKGGRFTKLQKYRASELQKLGCQVRSTKNYEEIEAFIREVESDEVHTT